VRPPPTTSTGDTLLGHDQHRNFFGKVHENAKSLHGPELRLVFLAGCLFLVKSCKGIGRPPAASFDWADCI